MPTTSPNAVDTPDTSKLFRVGDAAKLLSLVEQVAEVGHWRLELPEGRVIWSPEVYRMHGLDPNLPEPDLELAIKAYLPEDRPKVQRYVDDAIASKSSFEFTLRIQRPSGEIRHVVSRGICEIDDEGEVPALFGVIMDITDVKRAEQAARESEARYRLISENATDMVVLAGLDTTRRYVSPASRDVLGYEPEELIGTKPLHGVHPEDMDAYGRILETLVSGAVDTAASRQRYRRKDGSYVWVEALFRLIRDAEGRPTSYVAAVRDIAERMSAQEALRQSEARFRLLAENASELIMLGHDDGRRSYVSPASLRVLGFTPEELTAMRLRDYVHPDDLQRLYQTTRRLSEGEQEVSIVYRALHKSRGWIWVEGGFRHIPFARCDEPTIVATFRDVSERLRQAEALQHAKEAAEAASQAKSDFLASMSHEIRTPLNGILGYTDLLLEEEGLDQPHVRLVERIQSAGSALLTVVNDILDFSEIENDKVSLEPRRFVLEDLVDKTASIVRGLAEKKKLDLRIVLDKRVPRALIGDEDRLRQILLNLLNNAVKFTPSGSVTLSVKRVAETKAGATLRFAVTDTGIGIPEDKRWRLFERFSQVDGSIRREFGGTGLGLAISKTLVEMMGGRIGVDGAPGHGTRFWLEVTLPVGDAAEETSAAATPAASPSRRAKILLVEDLEINQELALAVLRNAGHDADLVADGAEAVMAVTTKPYDLVLMDIHMPGMDGIAATRRIRELDHPASAVPIVAMTANVLPDQVAKFKAAGMNDHVGKPFKRAELCEAIDRWAGAAVVATAGSASESTGPSASFDETQYRELEVLLGVAAASGLLAKLDVEVRHRLSDARLSSGDFAQIAHDAHAIVSAGGLLGFSRLSIACTGLEQACRQNLAVDEPLQRVREERDIALGDIETIRAVANATAVQGAAA